VDFRRRHGLGDHGAGAREVVNVRAYPLTCGLALLALVASYANHFQNAFHFDDVHTIQNNLFIRSVRNIPEFFVNPHTFSALPSNQSYRPLLSTTLAVDYRLAHGLNPVVFHATSFALFAAQCLVLLILYRRLMDLARPHPWNRWLALFAASWYGLHTANAETVNYIIARSEILSTLGVTLALLMFASTGRARHWHLYVIPAVAAVLAKEQGAMVVPLLMLYAAIFEGSLTVGDLIRPRAIVRLLRAAWPAVLVCPAILIIGLRLSTTMAPGGASRWSYLLTQPFVILHYVYTFFLPVALSADTDWQPVASAFDERVIIGVAFIAVALWIAVVAWRRRETRPIAFGLLWFFVALIPTSSIVPLAEVLNDHRLYFPFVGLTLAVTWSLGLALAARQSAIKAPRPQPLVIVAAITVLLAHAAGTWQRNIVWRTEESLWLDVVQKSPKNGRGLMTYGVIKMGQGQLQIARQYFDRALELTPQYAYLHVNMGVLNGALGNGAEAERHFRLAQQYDPANPVAYVFYARWLKSSGRAAEALTTAARGLELSPADVDARALVTELTGDATRARTPEDWLSLSLAHYQAQRYQDSLDASRQALRLRPMYAEAFNNLCAAENMLRRFDEAAADCRSALAIKPDFPLAGNNLAVALRSK
jgi:tetratricopeptide (TPR) repeat protein